MLRLPRKRQPRASGGHAREALCIAPATPEAAAGQRRPRAPQLLQEALCTAPATQTGKSAGYSSRPACFPAPWPDPSFGDAFGGATGPEEASSFFRAEGKTFGDMAKTLFACLRI